MRRLAIVLVLVLAAAVAAARVSASHGHVAVPRTSSGIAGCGVARWPVKTLADATASSVDVAHVVPTTIALLAATHAQRGTQDTRAAGVERTVFSARASLLGASVAADGDLVLQLRDLANPNARMTAEVPAFRCTRGALPSLRTQMAAARASFTAACGSLGHSIAMYFPETTVRVTGVGFVERTTDALGVPHRRIELHPVLRLAVRNCR
jgi:hypothetical protein